MLLALIGVSRNDNMSFKVFRLLTVKKRLNLL